MAVLAAVDHEHRAFIKQTDVGWFVEVRLPWRLFGGRRRRRVWGNVVRALEGLNVYRVVVR